jgi:predicted metal-dependent hydrolase
MVKKESVRIIDFEDIGQVSFIRRSSARNLKITIKPFRKVVVTVPFFVSFEAAGSFVKEKQAWIRKSQARFTRYSKGLTTFEEDTVFNTRDHVLQLGRHQKATIQTLIKNRQIQVIFPDHADVRDPRVQRAIRKAVLAAWRMEAGKYLPGILQGLAIKHNFTYNKVTVRNNKTRWGSCSRDNNINLNIHLVRLPAHLCEYVVLHELCHTLHKHHQKAFWQLLDKVTGGRAKLLDKELNGHSPEIW